MTDPETIPSEQPEAEDGPGSRLGALLARADDARIRVQRIEVDGRVLWLKRPERRKSLRWRLQKGDPRRAFAADLAGLRFLAEQAVPAPALVHIDANGFVTADAGRPLDELLRETSDAEGAILAEAAARTLAKLHHAGARHGRPKLRDICWDGETARLIDLERFRPNASAPAMGLDWAILLHSLLETAPEAGPVFASAVRTMRGEAPAPAVAAASTLIRRLGQATPLLRWPTRIWPENREISAAARLPQAFAAV